MIDNNCVPYIKLFTNQGYLKFLIDTGANKNCISPKLVKNENNCKQISSVVVRNIRGIHELNKYVEFNPFPSVPHSKNFIFYVFEFSEFFDGMIGYETLQNLRANICSTTNTLILGDKVIQMFKKGPDVINLNAHETRTLQISLNAKNGDFLIEKDINVQPDVHILDGLYSVENRKATVLISNYSENPVTANIPELSIEINNFETVTEMNPEANIRKDLFEQIRANHLNTEEKKALMQVIVKFQNCFYLETDALTFANDVKHSINTDDEIPVHAKSYRYPFCHREEVQRQVLKMLEQGIIRHSNSPWSSPIWVVPKKLDASGQQKWRLVVDYRKLNEKTIDDRYPMPNITEILDKLGKCQYFSTLDLASGFHQIEVDPKDIQKTAFRVEQGHYEYVRMPFGLKNAPATFQRVMDNVLRELIGKVCLVYMDDIIIFSTSLQEHMVNLSKVFQALSNYNLKIQLDKSEFLKKEVAFLGHIVTPNGVKPNPDKIEAIKKWPLPRNEKELRGFLGTLGYYRRFVKDFAKIVKPLTVPLQKDKKIEHTEEFVETFEKCKSLLTSSHILQYPDFSQPFNLTTDASDFAIGAVLSQGSVGKDRPVAYASRTLTKSEQNYSTIEKELLAIVWACKYFRPYLFGQKFTLYTDHKPLTYVISLKNPNGRLIRWRLTLEEFSYEIKYREGRQNVVADGLSRINYEMNANSIDSGATSHETTLDSSTETDTVHSANTDDSNFIPMTEVPINHFSNQIILHLGDSDSVETEEVFPKVFRHKITRVAYTVATVLNIFKDRMDYKRMNCMMCPESVTNTVQTVYRNYFSRNRSLKVRISQKMLEDVRSLEDQNDLISTTHNRAHRGADENHAVLSESYFFPGMKKKIQQFISLCESCKKAKYDRKPYKIKYAESPLPRKPFDIVHIDVLISGPNRFLSAVDKLSRYGILIPMKSRSIIDVRSALTTLISTYGSPKLIVSDNEPALKSVEVRGLMATLGIEMYFTPSDASEVNGIVERFHSTVAEILRSNKYKFPGLTEKELFEISVSLYNSTIHSATKSKPIEIFYGIREGEERPLNLELLIQNRDKIFDDVLLELQTKQRKDLEYHNKDREQEPTLETDQKVYLKVQGLKSKTKDKFKPVQVETNNEKTFIDSSNRKLHKMNVKRIPD